MGKVDLRSIAAAWRSARGSTTHLHREYTTIPTVSPLFPHLLAPMRLLPSLQLFGYISVVRSNIIRTHDMQREALCVYVGEPFGARDDFGRCHQRRIERAPHFPSTVGSIDRTYTAAQYLRPGTLPYRPRTRTWCRPVAISSRPRARSSPKSVLAVSPPAGPTAG
jgi:hypothetical protein